MSTKIIFNIETGKYTTADREEVLTPSELAAMEAERIAYESSREFKELRISELKSQLSATDYKALKFMEGWLTEDEYAPIKAERQAIRDEINKLEEEIKSPL